MTSAFADIATQRRWNATHRCPVCNGFKDLPQGKGVRCYGYLSADGGFAHCVREEYAGGIPMSPNSQTFAHKLEGMCRCGVVHIGGFGAIEPQPRQETGRTEYQYFDADGSLVGTHLRIDYDDGSKEMPWSAGSLKPHQLPLYNLHGLLEEDDILPVYFTEGEKSAQTLIDLGILAVACGGGADQTDFGTAFEPLIGRTVVILPDNDAKGAAYAERVRLQLREAGALPILLPLPGIGDLQVKGADIVDWLAAGHAPSELGQLTYQAIQRRDAGIVTFDSKAFPGLNIRQVDDFLALNLPKPRWLVEGFLNYGGVSLLVAKAKVGKSTIARDIIEAVLRGENWTIGQGNGATVARCHQEPVIYCALEEHGGWLQDKFRDAGLAGFPLYIHAMTEDIAADDKAQAFESLERFIQVSGAKFVVIDPIADFMDITDINSYSEVRKAVMRLTALARRTQAHIMVVHHANKSGVGQDGILGSSAYSGAVDTMILLRRGDPDKKPVRGKPVEDIQDRFLWTVQRYTKDLPETKL